ncbi:SAP domain-containing protein [Cohnella lubricantis]|uniref:SAP domain-containing protein n=1 Tax=Cohnella lubricantis TaxID=2163172 RepID=A0A841TIM4_9BACL|nr:SAP domain-containing protein [Cohnella lubricantis]MBB6678341.1 SAP domain-containing protein [Cohnella lubricantis]MBP2120631.1 hypothetical protein [Cohnella lubricantis]
MNIIQKIFKAFKPSNNSISKSNISADNTTKNHLKEPTDKINTPAPLKPAELLLLDYVTGSSSNIQFPGYFEYRYEINPHLTLKKLIDQGYLSVTHNVEENMRKSTMPVLKDVLKQKSLKTSGKKEDLILRIQEHVDQKELSQLFPDLVYQLTEQGQKAVQENDHIWFFHSQNYVDVTIDEAQQEKVKKPGLSKFEIGYKILNIKKQSRWKERNFGLYRNILLGFSVLQEQEGKYEESLRNLFEICFIDLSGMSNNFDKQYLHIVEKNFFPYEESTCTLAPGIKSRIVHLRDELNLSENDFKELYFGAVNSLQVPFHIFTKQETYQILVEELNENQERLKQIYLEAKKRYKFQNKR